MTLDEQKAAVFEVALRIKTGNFGVAARGTQDDLHGHDGVQK